LDFSGQLEKLTGKGVTGTYQLMDGAAKTGTRFEDAIEDAIIATNEPKDCSFQVRQINLACNEIGLLTCVNCAIVTNVACFW
jgi:hypothetical protein